MNGPGTFRIELRFGDDIIVGAAETGRVVGDAGTPYVTVDNGAEAEVHIVAGNDTLYGGYWMYGDIGGADIREEGGSTASASLICGDDLLIGSEHTVHLDGDGPSSDVDGLLVCGDDTIVGGPGDNYMFGDGDQGSARRTVFGDDTFVFRDDFGDDVIYYFGLGNDVLRFEGYGDIGFEDLEITQLSDITTLISLEAFGGGTIALAYLQIDEITADDCVFV